MEREHFPFRGHAVPWAGRGGRVLRSSGIVQVLCSLWGVGEEGLESL